MRGSNAMSNWADHLSPCCGHSPDSIVMTVDLAPFQLPDRYERLIVAPSPQGDYVVACLPFFTYGIQFGDLIKLQQPGNMFERVLESSGLRTLRIAFNSDRDAGDKHEQLHGKIIQSGLPHEWYGSTYVSVLIRHARDQEHLLSRMDDFLENGSVCWEVDPESFDSGLDAGGAGM